MIKQEQDMSKLGYTWYPKDWTNDESVFELTLAERGLFRELIDMAMLNDNKTKVKLSVWQRKFAVTERELEKMLIVLEELDLINIENSMLTIPSCEKRLVFSRAGKKGGSKPKPKPSPKPLPKQIEIEIENKINISFDEFWNLYNKKVGSRANCEKKWNKLKDSEREKIISTLPTWLSQIKDKQFQPHPQTYLNQERWNDEVPGAQPKRENKNVSYSDFM